MDHTMGHITFNLLLLNTKMEGVIQFNNIKCTMKLGIIKEEKHVPFSVKIQEDSNKLHKTLLLSWIINLIYWIEETKNTFALKPTHENDFRPMEKGTPVCLLALFVNLIPHHKPYTISKQGMGRQPKITLPFRGLTSIIRLSCARRGVLWCALSLSVGVF